MSTEKQETATKPKQSLIAHMAQKFHMEPAAFERTVRAMVMPEKHTNEQFGALMMVAKEYDLNPLTKEIYAFPAKGGGIVPIVSIDGWVHLVNDHPACDGFEFEFEHDEKGELFSCTCKMYRKDRSRPVTVTEYYRECVRSTEPWKMKHRMLRHKALIQAARYAFGFSGIYDEDEASRFADMKDATPKAGGAVPPIPPGQEAENGAAPLDGEIEVPKTTAAAKEKPAAEDIEDAEVQQVFDDMPEDDGLPHGDGEEEVEGSVDDRPQTAADIVDDTEFFQALESALDVVNDEASVEEVWNEFDPMARFDGKPMSDTNQGVAMAIKNRALGRIKKAK